ncbi:MAG: lamin tail domain-containing protein [Pirellulales bacterium]|nr:lamin tail domain-containing protein [Pirellulales bacterium]
MRLALERLEPRLVLDAGPLVISELLAVNNGDYPGALSDADGDLSDWLEIYNPTGNSVNLDGWYLSDDSNLLTKWQFPAVSISADQYRVVFASGKDRIVGSELHTNFRLDGDGEYLALVQPDGQTISHAWPDYPRQYPDVSYGLSEEAAAFTVEASGLTYHVPTSADAGLEGAWTAVDFDDSPWDRFAATPQVLITEMGTTSPDFVEIQNLSGGPIDTSGWVVAVNNGSGVPADINSIHDTLWALPNSMAPGEVLYQTDTDDHPWGENIYWSTAGPGWAMIVDDHGNVVDFAVFGYSEADVASLAVSVNGFDVTAAEAWGGPAIDIQINPSFSLQRQGDSDHDSADDWASITTLSMGQQNAGLQPPFSGLPDPGIGFELSAPGLGGAVQIDVAEAMHGTNASLWARIPFEVDNPGGFNSMTLRMKYNDGFVAYLNGQVVASRNAPGALAYNAAATAARSVGESLDYEEIDVSDFLDALVTGTNVLAIHGLNVGAADGNFLILPRVVATSAQYFDPPSPGGPNGVGYQGVISDTSFSVDRGFFDAPFEVEITTATPEATIYYTIDGSLPTEANGALYTGRISVGTTTTLRAAAFKPGYRPTNVDTQTYLFIDQVASQRRPAGYPTSWGAAPAVDYDVDPEIAASPVYHDRFLQGLTSIPTLSLVLPVEDIFGPAGIYSNTQNELLEVATSAELLAPDDPGGGFQIDCGLKLQGGASRVPDKSPKHSLSLRFRNEYGAGRLDYPLFEGSPVEEFNSLQLRAMFNNSWIHWAGEQRARSQYIRDQWARDSLIAMGQDDAGRGCYVQLYINGLYWGLYNVHERPEASHYAAYNGGDDDAIDALNGTSPIDGNLTSYNRMRSVVASRNWSAIQEVLDVDNYIDWTIFHRFGGNTDLKDTENWRAAGGGPDDLPWKFYAWDSEHILENVGNTSLPVPSADPPGLFSYLDDILEFRVRFADRLHRHLFNDGALTPSENIERWMERANEIDLAVIGESARWGDYRRDVHSWQNGPYELYTRDGHWVAERNHLINYYFPSRTTNIINRLRSDGLYPNVNAPVFYVDGVYQHGGLIASTDPLTMPAAGGVVYYTLDGSDPRLPGGNVSPGTRVFDGTPLLLADSARVKARALSGGQWSALNEAEFLVGQMAAAGNLAITELNYNPYPPTGDETADGFIDGNQFEFIELGNIGPDTIDLSGVQLTDGIDLTLSPRALALLDATFDTGPGGFSYADDAFEGTAAPEMAAGSYEASGGVDGGGLRVLLGPDSNYAPCSGAWSGTFSLVGPATVDVSLRFRMILGSGLESSEFGEVILEIDGVRYGGDTNDSLMHGIGDGNGGGDDDSGWRSAGFSVPLSAGEHTITFGAYNNRSTSADEFVEALFDNVTVTGSATSLKLAAGQRVVIVSDPGAFAARYGAGAAVVGRYDGQLRNEGERIAMVDRFGQPILQFEYNDAGVWPGRADGRGATLELIDPAAVPLSDPQHSAFLEDGNNWRSSSEYGGTPGTAGTGPLGDVVVNEVLTHTDWPSVDTIELHNTTAAAIDIGGWYLSDSWGWGEDNGRDDYRKFRIPDGTSVPAYGYVVFDEDDFNPTPLNPGPGDFALDGAHGDDVWLMEADAAGNLTRFADHVEFGPAANGETFGRWPDAAGVLYPMSQPTFDPPNRANSGPRVGPVVISEVMYNPGEFEGADDLEYVEICNPTPATIDLTGWRLRKGVDFEFPAGTELQPGKALVVVPFALTDPLKLSAFLDHYGIDETVQVVGGYRDVLDNGGESVQLQDPDLSPADEPDFIPRLLEDEVKYDDDSPWPPQPDGNGLSLHRTAADAWGHDQAAWTAAPPSPGLASLARQAMVVGRHVFYNQSAFDGNSAALDARDDDAIAVDKQALLPGQTATLANYTSYYRGINGVMVDLSGLGDGVVPGADDFEFRVGNDNSPAAWAAAPAPIAITARPDAGVGGSDRVTIVWDSYAVAKQWLQITVLATADTGLAEPDVFYFGNAVGEAGNAALDAKVNASDMLLARNNPRNFLNPAPVDFLYDFNRDARVNATDMLLARNNQTHFLTALRLISVPEAAAKAGTADDKAATACDKLTGREAPSSGDWRSSRTAWLYEFEQLVAARPSARRQQPGVAVDAALATEAP